MLPLVARFFSGNAISLPNSRPRIPREKAVSPSVIVIAPSRELARQVGKVWGAFLKNRVATVFGGPPLERHSFLLRSNGGADVVVATAVCVRVVF